MRNSYFIFIFIFCENYTGMTSRNLSGDFWTTTAVLKYLMMWRLVQYVLGNCAAFSVDVWKHQLGRFGKLFAHPSLVWFLDRIWYEWSISALLDQLLYIFVSINWLTCRKSTKIRKIVHSIGPERKSFLFLALFILSILSRNSS